MLTLGGLETAYRLSVYECTDSLSSCNNFTHVTFLSRVSLVMYSYILYSTDIPDSFVAVEECDPENITLDVLDTEIYISWDIKYYDILDCSFLVTVWNCSHSDTPSFNCTVNASNQRVTRMELNNCLQQSYSYHSGTIIDIKWHDPQCVNDNGCSKDFYMPELFSTGNYKW